MFSGSKFMAVALRFTCYERPVSAKRAGILSLIYEFTKNQQRERGIKSLVIACGTIYFLLSLSFP